MPTALLILARALQYGSGMILVGVVVFRWLVLLPAFARASDEEWQKFGALFRRLNRLFLGAVMVLVLAGLTLFWAVTAEMSDSSLPDALAEEPLRTVFLQTQFGTVCQWRLGLAFCLALAACALARHSWQFRRTASALEIGAGILAIALTISVAWMGHAAALAGATFPWRILADSLHLLCAAIWPTGLLPFALFLKCSRRIDAATMRHVLNAIVRFSNLSLFIVGALAVTGVINSVFLVGSFSALVGTDYGRILCLKLSIFAVILGFASWNRFRLLPLLFSQDVIVKDGARPDILRRLQNFVAIEFALAVAIVVVVSFLGVTPPPR